MQEVHCDGHEKLGGIALRLGDVGFGIYGFRCHTGKVLHVDVVPNDRNPLTVAHCYLDFVSKTGGEFIPSSTFACKPSHRNPASIDIRRWNRDRIYGGHTNRITVQYLDIRGVRSSLLARRMFLGEDELSELDRPATRSLKSTDNIPAESMWSYWLEDEGANLKTVLLQGHDNGLFAPGNPLHACVFLSRPCCSC